MAARSRMSTLHVYVQLGSVIPNMLPGRERVLSCSFMELALPKMLQMSNLGRAINLARLVATTLPSTVVTREASEGVTTEKPRHPPGSANGTQEDRSVSQFVARVLLLPNSKPTPPLALYNMCTMLVTIMYLYAVPCDAKL
ncbi:hypothetical protein NDU88_006486 [Pleurodeles waltl]|uniref:Uncharacterized protein n=1 Tax=Pleurodeles waltl TaxID=8319 RepID=A0AAV7UP52_PLEWA|nr:hypothetical protein NDU88_006486 [Pleurodeles waltl]